MYEAREFICKARACCAPGLNGISFKLYNNYPFVLVQLTYFLHRAWREDYITGMVFGWWGLDTKGGEFHWSGFLLPNPSPQGRSQDLWSNCQANDIIPPPKQIHQHFTPEGWHPRVPWLPGTSSDDLEIIDDCKAWEEVTPCGMTRPCQRLWICASQLRQVCTEVLPHPV